MSKPVPKEVKKIDDLLAESEETIRRLEKLRSQNSGRSVSERISLHAKRHSNRLLNIALAGGVLAVALARLSDKYAHQVCTRRSSFIGVAVERLDGYSDNFPPCGLIVGKTHYLCRQIKKLLKRR